MGKLVRARVRVRGLVQGVGYRYFVRNTAVALGLNGFVRNRPDGAVEVVAEGDGPSVNALIRELRTGPRYAHVEGIDIEWEMPTKDLNGFDYAF